MTFDPTSPGTPTPIAIDAAGDGLNGVACPSSSQCTAVDNFGREVTFNPTSPGAPTPIEIAPPVNGATGVPGVACPSISQCTAVAVFGREVTFNPTSPGTPTPINIDGGNNLDAVACPSSSQCTAVDASGQEVSFDPTAPGTPSPTNIDRGRGLSAVACPSSSQCTAVDSDGYEITGVSQPHPTTTSVSCSSSVFAPGDATVCRATVTDTAGSGQTAPTGNVSFTNSGTGRFFGSPCTLSGGGASASCAVVFTSFVRGGQVITANYGGDASHSASSGSTLVLVALPGSSSGCLLAGHGQITAANGDRAHFAMLVAATPTLGAERYRDKGPATPFRLRSTTVDALTCSVDATRASAFGTATINGAGSLQYRIDIQLSAGKGGRTAIASGLPTVTTRGQSRSVGHVDIHVRNP